MPQKKTEKRFCVECGKKFYVTKTVVRKGHGLFCGRSCAGKDKARKYLPLGRCCEKNPAWRGGLSRFTNGYWYVNKPEHPLAMKSGYVKRANLVMEEKLGRLLLKGEVVHHKDHDRENDSPDNLELYKSTSSHSSKHGSERTIKPKIRKPDSPYNKRYEWPSNKDLLEMKSRMTLRAMAKVIGCNFKTVHRRLQKISLS